MLRLGLFFGVAFALCLEVARADEFSVTLVKVADGKITFSRGVGKKKTLTTLPADEKCRVVAAKFDAKAKKIEAGDAIADGFKNPLFDKLATETVEAWVLTNADNDKIIELRLFQSLKKKGK